MSIFLSDEEVADLTGYRQPSKQIIMLKEQKVPFYINRAGHPRIARATLEGRKVVEKTSKTWSPSWAASQ